MGLAEWWSKRKVTKQEKKIAKYARKISHINTTHETREQIIRELCDIPGEASTAALLKRFDLTLHDKPIKDESEKELIAKVLIERGKEAIVPVQNFIKETQNVSWPFDILKQIVEEEDYVNFVLSVLTTEEALFNDQVIEKRIDVLNAIMNLQHKGIYNKVLKLIDDDDDRIKILALNILANQENIDEVREKLLLILVDPETPPRLMRSIIDIFSRKEWKLTGYKNKIDALLPKEDYFINKDGIIRRRQRGDTV